MAAILRRGSLYLADHDGELVPTARKSAAHAMPWDEAEARAKKINQYTDDPYEVVGVRSEVE